MRRHDGAAVVKELPKKIWRQDIPTFYAEMRERFEIVRDRTLTLIKPWGSPDDDRRGFGVVYAMRPVPRGELMLDSWHWRRPNPRDVAMEIGATRFADDPMGAMPTDPLAQRMSVASAFAEALNALINPENGRFLARPLEVVLASAERPEGVHHGVDEDVLSVDLMAGLSVPQVLDRMIREEVRDDPDGTMCYSGADDLQMELWHRLERLNAVRAMFDPKLRQIAVPDISTVRRHLEGLRDFVDFG